MAKVRIDELLVQREIVESLAEARGRLMAGEVIVDDHRIDKAGTRVDASASIRIRGRKKHRFVSRGGLKLEGALHHFGLSVTDFTCLDLGASTGGFTDCLLQFGAKRVYAVDVGYGLLDWSLRADDRVTCLERTHAARLDRLLIPDPLDFLVADISFNSLARIIPPAISLLAPRALAILLVKPQFEAAREEVGDGGIVSDDSVHHRVCDEVRVTMASLGANYIGLAESSILGTTGNKEFLMALSW